VVVPETSSWKTKRLLPTTRAKQLRIDSTKPEKIIWEQLRAHRLGGLKFRRQVIVGHYIADFVCKAKKLIIEIDGLQHTEESARLRDEKRTADLGKMGYRILRYSNDQILHHLSMVIDDIYRQVGMPLYSNG
jgi:very-short-patch-repair endonuclease